MLCWKMCLAVTENHCNHKVQVKESTLEIRGSEKEILNSKFTFLFGYIF